MKHQLPLQSHRSSSIPSLQNTSIFTMESTSSKSKNEAPASTTLRQNVYHSPSMSTAAKFNSQNEQEHSPPFYPSPSSWTSTSPSSSCDSDSLVFTKLSFIPSAIYLALVEPRSSLDSLLSSSSETGLNNRQMKMISECEVVETEVKNNNASKSSVFTGKINTCQQKAISRKVHYSFHPSTTLLLLLSIAIFSLLSITPCSSAPSPYSRLKSPREKGCYYLLKHYKNGEQIETNEPCLNCSCNNSMLMCYLRVCPYVRPLGDRCIIEKVPGECCPRITCPDVPSLSEDEDEQSALTTTTTTTTTTAAPVPEDGSGCWLDDKYYKDGAQMPNDPSKPCEVCYCIRNTSSCVMQECALAVAGCSPVYSAGSCCPSRYNCSAEAATTVPPGLRHPSAPEIGCRANGRTYVDGEAVPSRDPCEHCYCMKHEIVCAVQECQAPCEGCIPIPSDQDKCCPERYECPAPTRTVPPKNVNFGNESFTSDTTTQSSHKITSPSSEGAIELTSTTVTPKESLPGQDKSNGEGPSSEPPTSTASSSPMSSESPVPLASSTGQSETVPVTDPSSGGSSTTNLPVVPENQVIKESTTQDDHKSSSPSASAHFDDVTTSPSASLEPKGTSVLPVSQDETLVPSLESHDTTRDSSSSPSSSSSPKVDSSDASDAHKKGHDTGDSGEKDQQPPAVLMEKPNEKPLDDSVKEPEPELEKPVSIGVKDDKKDDAAPSVLGADESAKDSPLSGASTQEPSGLDNVTDSPVVKPIPPESLKMFKTSHPASQPRRDETGDIIDAVPAAASKGQSTRRPGINRKGFPGAIPGEGICRHEGKVYQNGDEVISSSPCVELCMCINSVVYCDETVCHPESLKPVEGQNCSLVKLSNECCPRYECVPYVTTTTTSVPEVTSSSTVTGEEGTSQGTSSTSLSDLQEEKQTTTAPAKVELEQVSSSATPETTSTSTSASSIVEVDSAKVTTVPSVISSESITTVTPVEEATTLASVLSTITQKVTELFTSTTTTTTPASTEPVKESEEPLAATTAIPILPVEVSSEISSTGAIEKEITTIASVKDSVDANESGHKEPVDVIVTSQATPVTDSISSIAPPTTRPESLPGVSETTASSSESSINIGASSSTTMTSSEVTTTEPETIDEIITTTKKPQPNIAAVPQADHVVIKPVDETPVATSTPSSGSLDESKATTLPAQVTPEAEGEIGTSQVAIVTSTPKDELVKEPEVTTQIPLEISSSGQPVDVSDASSPLPASGDREKDSSTESSPSAVPTTVPTVGTVEDVKGVSSTSESPLPTSISLGEDKVPVVSEQSPTTILPKEPVDDIASSSSHSPVETPEVTTHVPQSMVLSSTTVEPIESVKQPEATTVAIEIFDDIVTTIKSVVKTLTGSSTAQPVEEEVPTTIKPIEPKDTSVPYVATSSSTTQLPEEVVTTVAPHEEASSSSAAPITEASLDTSSTPEQVSSTEAPEAMVHTSIPVSVSSAEPVTTESNIIEDAPTTIPSVSPASSSVASVASSSEVPISAVSEGVDIEATTLPAIERELASSSTSAPSSSTSSLSPVEVSSESIATTVGPVIKEDEDKEPSVEITTEAAIVSQPSVSTSTHKTIESEQVEPVTTFSPSSSVPQVDVESSTTTPLEVSSSSSSSPLGPVEKEPAVTVAAVTPEDEKVTEKSSVSTEEKDQTVTTLAPTPVEHQSDEVSLGSSTSEPSIITTIAPESIAPKEVISASNEAPEPKLPDERVRDVPSPVPTTVSPSGPQKVAQEIVTTLPPVESSSQLSSTTGSTPESVEVTTSVVPSEKDVDSSNASVEPVTTITPGPVAPASSSEQPLIDSSSSTQGSTGESSSYSPSEEQPLATTSVPVVEEEVVVTTVSPSSHTLSSSTEKSTTVSEVSSTELNVKEITTTQPIPVVSSASEDISSSESSSSIAPTTLAPQMVEGEKGEKQPEPDSPEITTTPASLVSQVSSESSKPSETVTTLKTIDEVPSHSSTPESVDVELTTVAVAAPSSSSSAPLDTRPVVEVTTQVPVDKDDRPEISLPVTTVLSVEIVPIELTKGKEASAVALPSLPESSPVATTLTPEEPASQESVTVKPFEPVPLSTESIDSVSQRITTLPPAIEEETTVESIKQVEPIKVEVSSEIAIAATEAPVAVIHSEDVTTLATATFDEKVTLAPVTEKTVPSSSEKPVIAPEQVTTVVTEIEEKPIVEVETTVAPIAKEPELPSSSLGPETSSESVATTISSISSSSSEKIDDKTTTISTVESVSSSAPSEPSSSSFSPEITTQVDEKSPSSVEPEIIDATVAPVSAISTTTEKSSEEPASESTESKLSSSSSSSTTSTSTTTTEEPTTTIRQVLEDEADIKGIKGEDSSQLPTTTPVPVSSTTLASLVTTMLSGIKFNGTTEFIFKEIISSTSPAPTTLAPDYSMSSTLQPPSTTGMDILINATRSDSDGIQSTTWSSTLSPALSVSTESQTNPTTILSFVTPNETTSAPTSTSTTSTTTTTTTTTTTESSEGEEEHDDTTCIFEGRSYQSAEQIQRPHPCDFCFCFRGDIICLQQTCPPPIPRCYETPIDGFCCPRYECPVQSSSSSNSTTPSTVMVRGCNVDGQFYQVGEIVRPASGPCLECKCDHSGLVQCNPQNCSPRAPLLLRMNRDFFAGGHKRR